MSRLIIRALSLVGALVGLSFPGVSHSEDGIFDNGPVISLSNDMAVASTRPGALLAGLTGSFEISIAYIGASDFGPGNASRCGPVRVRIDELQDMGAGNPDARNPDARDLMLMPGEVLTLAPWTWQKVTFRTPQGAASATASNSTVAFRLVSERTRPGCNVVSSGLFFPSSGDGQSLGGAPIPFALLPSVSAKKAGKSKSHDRR